ncbi:MAG TPA: energy-coupling factor transporter transmembrane component T [Candidatus Limnocylindrales bacterium]
MIGVLEIGEAEARSPLGRASPLTKLAVAVVWLVGLAYTTDVRPPLVLVAVALLAGVLAGAIPLARFARGLALLWIAALGIATFNILFASANANPAAVELIRLGPLRLTEPAFLAGAGLGARVFAIAAVGVAFTLTTDSTRLVDALVQQGHVPERFGYGALAAYQAIPRLADDLATLRQARRIRGLRGSWHPRLFVGLLVLAIRHGDRLALAMDARGFGGGPRTRYRELHWQPLDLAITLGGLASLVAALATTRLQ